MPLYTYRALNAAGKSERGTIDAGSENEALSLLRGRQVYPVSLRISRPLSIALKGWVRLGGRSRMSPRELATFTRQMATLVAATVPYDAALRMVQVETSGSALQTVIGDVRERVVEGSFLADALAAHPNYFPPMVVNMVRSGESSGTLVIILGRLADYYENLTRLRTKIASALVYPAFMGVFGVSVVIFMLITVLPTFTRLFATRGVELPLPTRILMGASNVVVNHWLLLVIALVAVAAGLVRFMRSSYGVALRDWLELHLPVWRNFRQRLLLQRLCESLATMLRSGVELNHALAVSSEVLENRIYLKAMNEVSFDIQNRGMQLAASMRRTGLFPEDLCQMIAIGEETATLDAMLENMATRLSVEVNAAMESATALFEPLMILVMASGLGFMIVSILLPMLQLSKLVGS